MSYLFIYLFLGGELSLSHTFLYCHLKTFLPYIKQNYPITWHQETKSHGSKPLSSFYKFFLVSGGWVWIKISEHEHDCTAPFPHWIDSVHLHRAAALPWRFKALKAERPERGSPCWLLKESQMGFGVPMKGVLPWLVRAGTRGCYPVLAALKYFFPHSTLFYFMCRHRLPTWAGSRASS